MLMITKTHLRKYAWTNVKTSLLKVLIFNVHNWLHFLISKFDILNKTAVQHVSKIIVHVDVCLAVKCYIIATKTCNINLIKSQFEKKCCLLCLKKILKCKWS